MLGKYQSGQMGQTVNLLAYAFGGSNPSLPTQKRTSKRCPFFVFISQGLILPGNGRNQECPYGFWHPPAYRSVRRK